MTPTTHTARLSTLVAATLAAAALALTGCGGTEPAVPDGGTPPTSTAPPPPTVCTDRIDEATGVDTCDVEAVLSTAAAALYSYRPTEQPRKGVDLDAAATLLNPLWVQEVGESSSALAPVTGAEWDRWATSGITVDADANVTSDDHPADTDTLVRRVVAVQQTLVDAGGATIGELTPIALYMTATRANRLTGWAVSAMTVR
ncbi:hypothetical protein [Rhodococcoides corynebacterioides]|uniref:Lipoprotein n=1 Tax=Rhodococcoides corynebacterioides TaxID=53972 RepID=A0ABS7P3C5_9NOCA|nr:hypothetical protein [Rhodococcus corynebacterioides]MBY6366915.1 hypothetical protein [Rhodococcus corynebacterioides]MBY6407717.1 hypothetical protein [Rhodococcus corynebacterioides]